MLHADDCVLGQLTQTASRPARGSVIFEPITASVTYSRVLSRQTFGPAHDLMYLIMRDCVFRTYDPCSCSCYGNDTHTHSCCGGFCACFRKLVLHFNVFESCGAERRLNVDEEPFKVALVSGFIGITSDEFILHEVHLDAATLRSAFQVELLGAQRSKQSLRGKYRWVPTHADQPDEECRPRSGPSLIENVD